MMLQFHKMAADPSQLANKFAPANGTTNLLGLVRAAKQIGLKARSGELLQGERLGQEFDFLAVPMMFVEDTLIRINPKLGSILAPFSAVVRTLDRFVLKWRPLRRYAFRVVVILKWPRAHETG